MPTDEIFESLATRITCTVCGATFRFYAAVWIIGQSQPYCSKECAHNDGCPAPESEGGLADA